MQVADKKQQARVEASTNTPPNQSQLTLAFFMPKILRYKSKYRLYLERKTLSARNEAIADHGMVLLVTYTDT